MLQKDQTSVLRWHILSTVVRESILLKKVSSRLKSSNVGLGIGWVGRAVYQSPQGGLELTSVVRDWDAARTWDCREEMGLYSMGMGESRRSEPEQWPSTGYRSASVWTSLVNRREHLQGEITEVSGKADARSQLEGNWQDLGKLWITFSNLFIVTCACMFVCVCWIVLECACIYTWMYTVVTGPLAGVGSLFLPIELHVSNSGCQVWWQRS